MASGRVRRFEKDLRKGPGQVTVRWRTSVEARRQTWAEDAGASMEQITEAAGLTRITVHRWFTNRQALLEALAVSAKQQLIDAVEDARPDAAPVALYRVTANSLRVKSSWPSTLSHATPHTETAAALWEDINARTLRLRHGARGRSTGPAPAGGSQSCGPAPCKCREGVRVLGHHGRPDELSPPSPPIRAISLGRVTTR